MSGPTRRYALDVSEPFFRLTTDCLRLRSNETQKLQSLASLVNERATVAHKIDHNPETMRDHLHTTPTKGDIRIYLSVTKSSADNLAEAKKMLKGQIGSSMTLEDTLSILLFDYVVEQRANKVLAGLKINDADGEGDEPSAEGERTLKVIPIR